MELLDAVMAFRPECEQEEWDREELLRRLRSGENIWDRSNAAAHLTASGWVVSPDRKLALMAYHNLYDSWAWLGGHADGMRDLLAVARKEILEESGLAEVKALSDDIFSLETLCVDGHEKRGKYVSSHLHLNVTYLFEADPAAPIACKPDENSAVGWFPTEQIPTLTREPWFRDRIYAKLCRKAGQKYF